MPDTSAAGREAEDRAQRARQFPSQAVPEGTWRRQARLDRMAALIYHRPPDETVDHVMRSKERDDEAIRKAVERALLLAAAVDKALGIMP